MLPNAASVALVRKTDLLLIQRARAPMEGLWTLPGGRLEPGETAEECAQREVREELGLYAFALRPVRQLQVKQYRLQVFATEGFEGEIVPNPAEIRAWRWARADQLSGLRTTIDLSEVVESVFRMFDRS
jgi:8-oxo-dGTP pyrophosphatase MutT (NUDIX family)